MRLGALGLELFELGFWLKNVEMPAVFMSLAFWLLEVDALVADALAVNYILASTARLRPASRKR